MVSAVWDRRNWIWYTPSFFLSWLSSSVGVGRREKRVDTVLSQLLVEKVAVLVFIAHASFPLVSESTRILKGAGAPSVWLPLLPSASGSVGLFSQGQFSNAGSPVQAVFSSWSGRAGALRTALSPVPWLGGPIEAGHLPLPSEAPLPSVVPLEE